MPCALPPRVGGPLHKSTRSSGHRGPWRTLCEPSATACALDMPTGGCCLEVGIDIFRASEHAISTMYPSLFTFCPVCVCVCVCVSVCLSVTLIQQITSVGLTPVLSVPERGSPRVTFPINPAETGLPLSASSLGTPTSQGITGFTPKKGIKSLPQQTDS